MKRFVHGTVIDGTGRAVIENGEIGVLDGKIDYIGPVRSQWSGEAEVIDVQGKTVMPGIIDSHVHSMLDATTKCVANITASSVAESTITAIGSLKRLLSDGVVFFRELGGTKGVDVALAAAVAAGDIAGPDLIPCGQVLTMTGGHCWMFSKECDGMDEVQKAVRQEAKDGAGVIKFMATGGIHTPGNRLADAQFTREELESGIRTAHQLGLPTAAHALSSKGAYNAVMAGIDSLEHGCFMHEDEKICEMMAQKGTYYVPTLVAILSIAQAGKEHGISQSVMDKAIDCAENHQRSFEMALRYGLKVAFGTDRGTTLNHHDKGTRELALMNQYGMAPMDVIVSASKTSSELLGIDALYGTLEKGKMANFIVLPGNPLQDMQVVCGPKDVYKKGEAC